MATAKPTNNRVHEEISMITAGRNIQLGMLYDCFTDKPIVGVTTWSQKEIKDRCHVTQCPNTESYSFTEESEDRHTHNTVDSNVDLSLKASIVSGLIKVEGSGKYHYQSKFSTCSQNSVVTLCHKVTTKRKQISMPPLDTHNHAQILSGEIRATHIVTGVTYGAHAFFVFESESASLKTCVQQDNTETLRIAVAQIVQQLRARVRHNHDSTRTQTGDRVRCTYYGDFQQTCTQSPTNIEEAIAFCSKLPSFLEAQDAVPVSITLTPLDHFINKDLTFHDIHDNVLTMFLDLIHELEQMKVRYYALSQHKECTRFSGYKEVFLKYHRQICSYMDKFKQEISKLILEIRRDSGEHRLKEAVAKSKSSPFGTRQLGVWIREREKALGALEGLPDIQGIETPERFRCKANDPNRNFVVCFALPPAIKSETYLEVLTEYMAHPDKKKLPYRNFESFDLKYDRNVAGFYRVNANNIDEIDFMVTTFSHRDVNIPKEGSILLFTRGQLVQTDFEPPGQPLEFQKANGNRSSEIILSWQSSRHNKDVDNYKLKYGPISNPTGNRIKEVSTNSSGTMRCTIKGLPTNTPYEFQVFAVCSAGTSQGSTILTHSRLGIISRVCTVS